MGKKGVKPPNAGSGRKKGSKNKFTTLKQAFLNSFNELGGEGALTEWAKKNDNRTAFYQMITKLLPKEVEGTLELKNPPNVHIHFDGK